MADTFTSKSKKECLGSNRPVSFASDHLTTHLARSGYSPIAHTPSLWKHDTLPVVFSLVVDDFGVKYTSRASTQHLIDALKNLYSISIDWTGWLYLGLTLQWDYVKQTIDISMPGYVNEALHRFQHPAPFHPQDAPHSWTQPTYGTKVQLADNLNDSPSLDTKTITFV